MAADRGAFIDQSQSLNIHIAAPTIKQLTSMHFYGWKMVGWRVWGRWFDQSILQGLKTGMYYLRTRPAANPIQFSLDKKKMESQISAKVGC